MSLGCLLVVSYLKSLSSLLPLMSLMSLMSLVGSVSIDKLGRRIDKNKTELDMRRYYNLKNEEKNSGKDESGSLNSSDSDSSDHTSTAGDSDTESNGKDDVDSDKENIHQIESHSDDNSMQDSTRVDFARGEGQIESSSEESDMESIDDATNDLDVEGKVQVHLTYFFNRTMG